MTAITPLEFVHKKGIFGDHQKKRENDLLISIEEYCLEDLLPNLHVRHGEEKIDQSVNEHLEIICLLYTSPSPRDRG